MSGDGCGGSERVPLDEPSLARGEEGGADLVARGDGGRGLFVPLVALVAIVTFALGWGCDDAQPPDDDAAVGVQDASVECDPSLGRWIEQDLGNAAVLDDAGTQANLFGVWGVDQSTIWAVGGAGTVLFYDGTTWMRQPTPTDVKLTAVWGTSANNVWAVGFGGTVLRYDGTSWIDQSPPLEVFLRAGAPVPSGDAATQARRNLWGIWVAGRGDIAVSVYVVGDRGTALVYTDNRWTRIETQVEDALYAVWGADEGNVFAAGDFGTVMRGSAASGFAKQQTGINKHLRAVWGRSASDVYVAGVEGAVLAFQGSTWTALEGAPKQVLRAIWGPENDTDRHYLVGWDGALLQLTRGAEGAKFEIAGCLPRRRLESLWGTLVEAPLSDAGADGSDAGADGADATPSDDAGFNDLPAASQVPKTWIVGVSGTVLSGP